MTIIRKIHRMTEERQVIIDIYENDDESMDKVQSSSSLKDKLNAFIPNTLKHKSLFAFAVTVLCCLALLSLLVNIHNPTEYYSELQHQGLNQRQSRTLVSDKAALTAADHEFISQQAEKFHNLSPHIGACKTQDDHLKKAEYRRGRNSIFHAIKGWPAIIVHEVQC